MGIHINLKPTIVYDLEETCFACPTAWRGRTEDGKEVYVRYRWGYLSIRIEDEQVFGEQLDQGEEDEEAYLQSLIASWGEETGKRLFESHQKMKEFSGGTLSYDGTLTLEELEAATQGLFIWKTTSP